MKFPFAALGFLAVIVVVVSGTAQNPSSAVTHFRSNVPVLHRRKGPPTKSHYSVPLHRSHRAGQKCIHTDGSMAEDTISAQSDRLFQQPLGSSSNEVEVNRLEVPSPPLEIVPLIISGPSTNRVDLVFFADGYTQIEKTKFVEDALRLAEDISSNQTYNTVRPLLNFWGAFTPSEESGVGVGGVPKNTAFGLYRPGTELRGVYYAKPEVAAAACSSMGEQCDYPILMGNDPLYGGSGGRFTVITPSIANGALVLRHELGHSIIPVGDEYDGGRGSAYFGVNAFSNLNEPVPWAHWLSSPPNDGAPTRVEHAVMPLQTYTWTMLNVSTPWTTNFTSAGTYSRHVVRFSLSGLPDIADLKAELDGVDLGWQPRPNLGLDRWHYDIAVDEPLAEGTHELTFTLLNAGREGVAQLCSAEIMEFGDESEFVSEPGYYGVFPTYSDKNTTSYRPTNEDCLMRLVTTPNFCKVCIEGLWHALLSGIDLIDGIRESCSGTFKRLSLSLVPLAQFRDAPIGKEESLMITWTKDGKVLPEFANQTDVVFDGDMAIGRYIAKVKYTTEEVRVEKGDMFSDEVTYDVNTECSS